jgi:hypothetical protein
MITYDTVKEMLISIGFDNLKKISANKIAILTNENRVSVLEKVNEQIKNSRYDTIPTSESSVGKVLIDSISVLAKPAGKQGAASAGVGNENILVETINKYTETGPINVIFKAANKEYIVIGCKGATSVGADTAGRKKADVVLSGPKNQNFPISIKKDDAETWESADSYFGAEAEKIIAKAIEEKKTKLISEGSYYKIEPNIAVKANVSEKKDVVFGSDLARGGAVVTKTFNSRSFTLNENKDLVIDCTNIITELSDVKGDKDVYFLIRNDKTRKSVKKYPGIRVLASYKKRINKNVIIVERG